ncbi:MAG: CDP-diacylglycerol--glycerol-3-phosphate 3-phosphatidyltransferase [Lachnospiraceae bacterium]|nr:CDP-diacylglycerol--glycerol-3-phosphate 3-phosphatidyltransferase [Lachnospiraceae bacterium]
MSDTSNKKTIWNVPNILTMIRVILIIPFVVLLLGGNAGLFGPDVTVPCIWADVIFIVASLTDLFDGKIARKYNLVTNFGKFMDPLADKLLVCSALICLVEMSRIPAWMVILIIAREFIISGFRLVASDAGVVIAASYWGKFKTTFQMVAVIGLILQPLLLSWGLPLFALQILLWIALILTVISLIDYLVKNWSVMQ